MVLFSGLVPFLTDHLCRNIVILLLYIFLGLLTKFGTIFIFTVDFSQFYTQMFKTTFESSQVCCEAQKVILLRFTTGL